MRTANPVLNEKRFESYHGTERMTIEGTINKTFLLLVLLIASSLFVWFNIETLMPYIGMLMIGSIILGLVVALITIFKKTWAPVTAPIYALIEGVVLGALSILFEQMYPGIVFQAILLTFGVFFVLLVAYRTETLRATKNFRMGVIAATGAVMLVYVVSLIGSFFGFQIPLIHESGPVGIAFSAVVVVIAALNLILDFDFIEKGAEQGASKYMEFYAGFGLLVTLIWLYIEILRLLSKIRSR